jgi:hypothetical protein
METRGNRQNYLALNDGYDNEALPEDQLSSPTPELSTLPTFTRIELDTFLDTPDVEINPSESASQSLSYPISSTAADSSIVLYASQNPLHKPKNEAWFWAYFSRHEVPREWYTRKHKKRKLMDLDIQCSIVDQDTGKQCSWVTTDSKRQSSTSNLTLHLLRKHSIYPPGTLVPEPVKKSKGTLPSLWGKREEENLTCQQQLEKDILRWIVVDKQPFTTIESPEFRQIFLNIPGIALPFTSRHTLRQRLMDDFDLQRAQLKEELKVTCKTIALSLDIWTSKNHLPILGIIGHWLTESFDYRERVLEFKELLGPHSGENLAAAVEEMLTELNLERKLITITGDNASNNERMVSELSQNLRRKLGVDPIFRGLDSYVRCLAHILNLIVKDILQSLKSGNMEEAHAVCDNFKEGEQWSVGAQEPLARLRILALWIHRSPQQRQKWNEVCKIINLSNKYIEYDVDTRWNSTFRMLDDSLKARYQVDKFLQLQTDFPRFTTGDWSRLSQIHNILSKFNEFTLFVSEKKPQISLAVPIYYELHDLLDEASERKERFINLDEDISLAVKEGMKKYKKYYTFMDASDTYYTALILDPRVKGDLLLEELEDEATGREILQALRDNLHRDYPVNTVESSLPMAQSLQECSTEYSDVESRLRKRLQPRNQPLLSDIDRYFDSPRVNINDMKDPNWLCNWWQINKDEYPRMAAAARDYLAIPASEVPVERIFNIGRDILGIRRHSMNSETMRMLMLLDNRHSL